MSGLARAPRQVIDDILAHARAAAPNECCGLIIGTKIGAAEWRFDSAHPARNLLDSPTRYHLDPEDHFAAIRLARQRGAAVVATYHSHPASPAAPSPRDLTEASDPHLLYLIASLPSSEIRAYRLQDGNFRPVTLVDL